MAIPGTILWLSQYGHIRAAIKLPDEFLSRMSSEMKQFGEERKKIKQIEKEL